LNPATTTRGAILFRPRWLPSHSGSDSTDALGPCTEVRQHFLAHDPVVDSVATVAGVLLVLPSPNTSIGKTTDLARVAPTTGYIQSIDYQALSAAAADADAVVRFPSRPRQFVVQSATLAVAESCKLCEAGLRGVRTHSQDRSAPDIAAGSRVCDCSDRGNLSSRYVSRCERPKNTSVACVNWLADG